MTNKTSYYLNITIIFIISIISIYYFINDENNINNTFTKNQQLNIIHTKNNNNDNEIIDTPKTTIISNEDIKKSTIYKNYPNRFKELEKRDQVIKEQLKQQEERDHDKEEIKNNNYYWLVKFIPIPGIMIMILFKVISNSKLQDSELINEIDSKINCIDNNINSINTNKSIIEINKMKTITDPFILEDLLDSFKRLHSNSTLLEFKEDVDNLDKKQENNLNNLTSIMQTLMRDSNNKKLLQDNEIYGSKEDFDTGNTEDSSCNGSGGSNNEDTFYSNNKFKRLSMEVHAKIFLYQYKKWDKQKDRAVELVEKIKRENEKEYRDNLLKKQQQELKKKEYLESIEQIRESRYFSICIKVIVLLNVYKELSKLFINHLNSIIPTIICLNSNDILNNGIGSTGGGYFNIFSIYKKVLNYNIGSGGSTCIPIGIDIKWNLILMTIIYLIIIYISLTIRSNIYITSVPLIAITFYTYKIDYNNINPYLIHIGVNLILLIIWKLLLKKYQNQFIINNHKWLISPSIFFRLISIIIIILYNYTIQKYFLNSVNLITTI